MKKIFDVSVWKEGLRQLKMIGIMFLLITVAVAVLLPLGIQQQEAAYHSMYRIGFIELTFFVLLLAFGTVPLMALYLFRFLTKRDSSDFYHSVPHTRTCVYVSFAAAVFTWFLVLTAIYLAVSIGLVGIFPNVVLRQMNIGPVLVNYLVGAVLMLGITLLAVSLTGTTLTNLAVLAMFALLPRLVLTVSYYSIVSSVDFVMLNEIPRLLDPKKNVLFGILYGVLMGDATGPLYSWGTALYSGILGVIYLIAGWILFVKRKSELAGQTAIHPVLGLVFRSLPAFMVCLIPITIILISRNEGAAWRSIIADRWFEILVFYVLAILIYLLYELITTRKLSAMIGSLKGIWFLLVLNVIYVGCFQLVTTQLYQYQPEAEDVDAIQIVSDRYDFYMVDYFELIEESICYEDKEIIRLVCEGLEDTRELWKEQRQEFTRKFYGNREGYVLTNINFIEDGRVHGRKILLSESQYAQLQEWKLEDEAYQNGTLSLPEWSGYSHHYPHNIFGNFLDLRPEAAEVVYESLKKEIEEQGYGEWMTKKEIPTDLTMKYYMYHPDYPKNMVELMLPISSQLPVSYEVFVEQYATTEETNEFLRMKNLLQDSGSLADCNLEVRVALYQDGVAGAMRQMYLYDPVDPAGQVEKTGMEDWDIQGFAKELENLSGEESGQYLLQLSCSYSDLADESQVGEQYENFRAISKETYERLLPYLVGSSELETGR